ncbi:MAG: EamA family transporter [Anaerolineales bacterium]|nr:EamA family transporter [Anaerolineales bacterium]
MNTPKISPHLQAVLQALFVTFLWSTSWVLIKIGLAEIPALTFAGLRYSLAFLCLLLLYSRRQGLGSLRRLDRRQWRQLLALGIIYYGVTHGAQFLSLAYLPAVMATLVLGFTPVVVALAGLFILAERPTRWQWGGIVLAVGGLVLYFYPVSLPAGALIGLVIASIGMLANAGAAVLGRAINRTRTLTPLQVTVVSMGIGATLLLATGLWREGLPALSLKSGLIILWLAVVNTAFAFTLWNHTLRTLSAMESSLINNTMSVQIPILAVLFLGETLTARGWLGLGVVIAGVLIVQTGRLPKPNSPLEK